MITLTVDDRAIQIAEGATILDAARAATSTSSSERPERVGLRAPFPDAEAVMREIASVTPSGAGITRPRLDMAGLRYPVPTVELNPADRAALGVRDGDQVRVTSRRNSMPIGARLSVRVEPRN